MLKNKVAVIGNGYWSNIIVPYIRKYFDIKYIIDSKFDKNIIWNDSEIEAVFVITPVETHFEITKNALLNKKHVFVEKPITIDYNEAVELYDLSKKVKREIVTDYVYTFSRSVDAIEVLSRYENRKCIYIEHFQYGRFGKLDVFKVLGSHHLAILDMFFNIENLNFKFKPFIFKNGICTSGIIDYEFGSIILSLDSKIKNVNFKLFCNDFIYEYNPKFGYAYKDIKYNIDESNNLLYAVKYFNDVINGKYESNIKRSLKVTKIIGEI